MKKIIALIMAVVSLLCVMSVSAGAEGVSDETITVTVNETVFIFDADTTVELRDAVIESYFTGEDNRMAVYGLTCTLFGHKLESSIVTAITHKAKATSPRCLRERFDVEVCSRCDYTKSELISNDYIVCCA